MKVSSYLKISAAVLAIAGAQTSGAVVLAGYYDFVGAKMTGPPTINNPANDVAPGIASWAVSNYSATGNGGELGGFYGTSTIAVPFVPIGDGSASIKMIGTTSTWVRLVLTNNTGYNVQLDNLFFDAAATTGQTGRTIQVDFMNSMGTTSLGIFGGAGLIATSPQNFDDFGVGLTYTMADMETVSFVFTVPTGNANGTVLWLDDTAVTGTIVPEAGSLMAFGCMAMTGLMFRNRRK